MEFDRPYSRQEFIRFLKVFLPVDTQLNEYQNIPFCTNTNFATTATRLGSCKSLDLNVYEVKHNSRNDARIGLSKDAFRIIADEGVNRALVVFIPEDSNDNYRFSLVEITLSWDENDKLKRTYSNPRRYSYYLGKGVAYYTPNKYLNEKGRISSVEDLRNRFSVEVLSKDFYTKLYEWYQWALSKDVNVTFPNNPDTEKDDRENINVKLIRLITRLLFVWFIKQKGLVPDSIFDPERLKTILVGFDKNSSVDGNYYNAILQNLFFATLNCAIIDEEGHPRSFAVSKSGRDTRNRYRYKEMFRLNEEEILKVFAHIPFLNGGLFECLDKPKDLYYDQKHDILYDGFSRNATKSPNGNFKYRAFVPNILFFNDDEEQLGLINLLKQYNFTIEENSPTDAVISLDPELLGRVFENLLAAYNPETQDSARKATGSFYTPRHIVDYMVDEAIKSYILGKRIDRVNAEKLNILFEKRSIPADWTDDDKTAITDALKQVKILDPACGSGAFPMGALLRIVDIIELLNVNVLDRYRLKLDIIENCIYGVDIQPIAMLICKLRFFISLICEQNDIDFSSPETNFGINTLPNLETKFVAANTLIGADIRNYEDNWTNDEKLNSMKKELLSIRNAHFLAKGRAAKKRSERQDNATRQQLLDYIVSNAQKPDPEKIATYEHLLHQLSEELKQYKEEVWVNKTHHVEQTLFGVVEHPDSLLRYDINKKKRDELTTCIKTIKAEIAKEQSKGEITGFEAAVKQITEWNPYDQNSVSSFFDPEWMFCLKKKFDIVIGNPPYIQLQKGTGEKGIDKKGKPYDKKYGDLYEPYKYDVFAKTGDIYCLFYEQGWRLLKKGGHLCYITSNKWMRAGYGKALRLFLGKKTNPQLLLDFGGIQVFDSATVDTNILLFAKEENDHETQAVSGSKQHKDILKKLSDFVRQNAVATDFGTSDPWVILSPIEQSIKRKIEAVGVPLKNWDIQINYGIKTGYNEAFIITTEKRGEILSNCADEDERKRTDELIRPILRGRDIKRYGYEWANLWLIATFPSRHYDIELYPAVKDYLLSFGLERLEQTGREYVINGEKIKARKKTNNKWFETQDSFSYWDDFSKPKIVWKRIGSILRFSYDDRGCLGLDSTCFASGSHLAYLTCVLNSKVGHYLLKDSPRTGTGDLLISVQAIEPLMIPIAPNDSFDELLCRILSGSKDAETNAFHAISDLYGFNQEEREYIWMR